STVPQESRRLDSCRPPVPVEPVHDRDVLRETEGRYRSTHMIRPGEQSRGQQFSQEEHRHFVVRCQSVGQRDGVVAHRAYESLSGSHNRYSHALPTGQTGTWSASLTGDAIAVDMRSTSPVRTVPNSPMVITSLVSGPAARDSD